MAPRTRTLQALPISHAYGILQVNRAYLAGTSIVMLPYFDPELALDTIARRRVYLAAVVPSMMAAMLESRTTSDRDLSCLKVMHSGGAVLLEELRLRFEAAFGCKVSQGYGLSECSPMVTCYADDDTYRPGSVGPAVPGTRVKITDPAGRSLPVGESGEIRVRGPGVMQGYWRRPNLTKDVLVGDWLRTGDVGHLDEDGYLYVTDRVKDLIIRMGENLSPAEIENVLLRAPAVREAAVVGVPHPVYGEAVWAAVVVRDGRVASESALRAHAAEHLRRDKVPARIMFLARLPRNASGKVLKRRLRDWLAEHARDVVDRGNEPGATSAADIPDTLEKTCLVELRTLWVEVLELTPHGGTLGPESDFFELGADSLAAGRLVSRIRHRLGVQMPLAAIYDAPTLGEQVKYIEAGRAANGSTRPRSSVAPSRDPRQRRRAPLSAAQRVLWRFERAHPGTGTFNIATAVTFEDGPKPGAWEIALQRLTERHQALRSAFVWSGEETWQSIAQSVRIELLVRDFRECEPLDAGAVISRELIAEQHVAFDLGRAPLLRARLLLLPKDQTSLVLTAHHLIFDGWSYGTLLRELSELVRADVEGRAPSLPHVAVQLGDYAEWEAAQLRDYEPPPELCGLRARLSQARKESRDSAAPPQALGLAPAHRVSVPLPPGLRRRLEGICKAERVSLFMILVAAWASVIAERTRGSTVVITAPVSGRDQPEIEDTIGCFVATAPLVLEVPPQHTFLDVLAEARNAVLSTLAIPAFALNDLYARGDLEMPVHAEISFNNTPDVTLRLSDEHVGTPQAGEISLVMLDLVLELFDRGGELRARVISRSDRVSPSEAHRIAARLSHVLRSAGSDAGPLALAETGDVMASEGVAE
jgi:acyl carrier protein